MNQKQYVFVNVDAIAAKMAVVTGNVVINVYVVNVPAETPVVPKILVANAVAAPVVNEI